MQTAIERVMHTYGMLVNLTLEKRGQPAKKSPVIWLNERTLPNRS